MPTPDSLPHNSQPAEGIDLANPYRGRHTMQMFIQALLLAAALDFMWDDSIWWTILGFTAQGLFSARFLVQWLASEKHRRVVVPVYFWHFSIVGGWLMLAYTIHIWKAPLVLGAVASLITSHRNLYIHNRGLDEDEAAAKEI